MKAILLAAGEGKRMRPLTLLKPKAMSEVLGKPLLYHILKSLPDEIDELILVIGYRGHQIQEYFGNTFEGKKITYVWQEKALGTGHALFLCKPYIKKNERFLFILADDLHSKKALTRLIKHPLAVLVREHPDPRRFGVVVPAPDGTVFEIEEKPEKPKTNLVVIGVYVLSEQIFHYELAMHPRLKEYFMTDLVSQLLKDHKMIVEKTDFWHPVGYPHDLDAAEKLLAPKAKPKPNPMPVAIICGGNGTRLPKDLSHLPKSLVPIAGKPILQHQLEMLERQGFKNVLLALGHKADAIIQWLKDHKYGHVRYVVEKEKLGTGGAAKFAGQQFLGSFVCMNGDILADFNLNALLRVASGGHTVITGVELADVSQQGALECDESKHICAFREKTGEVRPGLINAGLYVLRSETLRDMPDKFSIEHDLFPKLAKNNDILLHHHRGNYWFNCGTDATVKEAQEYLGESKKKK